MLLEKAVVAVAGATLSIAALQQRSGLGILVAKMTFGAFGLRVQHNLSKGQAAPAPTIAVNLRQFDSRSSQENSLSRGY